MLRTHQAKPMVSYSVIPAQAGIQGGVVYFPSPPKSRMDTGLRRCDGFFC